MVTVSAVPSISTVEQAPWTVMTSFAPATSTAAPWQVTVWVTPSWATLVAGPGATGAGGADGAGCTTGVGTGGAADAGGAGAWAAAAGAPWVSVTSSKKTDPCP